MTVSLIMYDEFGKFVNDCLIPISLTVSLNVSAVTGALLLMKPASTVILTVFFSSSSA